jgi:Ca2+-binding RTX toxin-like protein
VFAGSGANIVYAGSRDVITGGNDSDQIWATAGDGNRLSGLGGDDDFVIGSAGNRVLGGDGNDVFTVLGGAGTNYLNGGAGSDQFWLVSGPGDLPAAQQVVMDFSAGVDKVGLRGAAFTDLSFSQMGANTMLSLGGTTIGQFTNVSAATLNNQANFVFA